MKNWKKNHSGVVFSGQKNFVCTLKMLLHVNWYENDAAYLILFHQMKRNYYLGNYKNMYI